MKKAIFLSSTLVAFLGSASTVLAQSSVPIQIKTPPVGINPATPVGTLLSNALTIVFVVAALAVLFMLIQGAFSWITSGGDKEKVASARKGIIAALVGLALLALAFVITRVVGQVVNLDILNLRSIPTLDKQCSPGQVYDPQVSDCVTERSR